MKNDIKQSEKKINELNSSEILSINIDPIKFLIKIHFFLPIDGKAITIELKDIALIRIAKDIKDDDGNYFVAKINFQSITADGGYDIFSKIGYPYFDMDGNVLTYPNRSLYYLSIEGDLCLDIVCGSFEIYQG